MREGQNILNKNIARASQMLQEVFSQEVMSAALDRSRMPWITANGVSPPPRESSLTPSFLAVNKYISFHGVNLSGVPRHCSW